MYKQSAKKKVWRVLMPGAFLLTSASYLTTAQAGATFKMDDTKWVSIGAGLKTSFGAVEDAAGGSNNKWGTDFFLNNIRLYFNGQIHEYLKLTFNTECHNCSGGGSVRVLDAIARIELGNYFNVWFGRTIVPAERIELDGPFYNPFFDTYGKEPFNPSDFGLQSNLTFPSQDVTVGGGSAGQFARDDGVALWGRLTPDKRLQYAIGAFDGLDGPANKDSNFLYTVRLSYNFWNIEDNPGYYTSSTYYGKMGDVFTLAVANLYHEDGVGTRADPGNFRGTSADVLLEKVLPNDGVVTFVGDYKNYGISKMSFAARSDPNCFCLFEGNSFSTGLLYLLPQKVWIGQFQPYVRFNQVYPERSSDRNEFEAGVNYVIDGHNARVSLIYQYGDIATKGIFDFGPGVRGEHVNAVKLGIQLQI
jgi:hypothetical protein